MEFDEALEELVWSRRDAERLPRLIELWHEDALDAPTFVRLLGEVWSSCEANGAWMPEIFDIVFEEMYEVFDPDSDRLPGMMDKEELVALHALPDQVRIYSGCTYVNREGNSWTLSRGMAEWFARRFAKVGREPIVLSAIVERNDITALKLDRKEEEVVLLHVPRDEEIEEEVLSMAA